MDQCHFLCLCMVQKGIKKNKKKSAYLDNCQIFSNTTTCRSKTGTQPVRLISRLKQSASGSWPWLYNSIGVRVKDDYSELLCKGLDPRSYCTPAPTSVGNSGPQHLAGSSPLNRDVPSRKCGGFRILFSWGDIQRGGEVTLVLLGFFVKEKRCLC